LLVQKLQNDKHGHCGVEHFPALPKAKGRPWFGRVRCNHIQIQHVASDK
jgi:hypothetical protein